MKVDLYSAYRQSLDH